jgi:hypothetical protein
LRAIFVEIFELLYSMLMLMLIIMLIVILIVLQGMKEDHGLSIVILFDHGCDTVLESLEMLKINIGGND